MAPIMRRVRRLCMVSFVAVGLIENALAADIVKGYVLPPRIATPIWTGFYIGGHAGYGWADPATTFATSSYELMNIFPRAQIAGLIPTVLDPKLDGFSGGGHLGYNWQFERYVFGIEADLSSGMKGGSTFVSASMYPFPQLVTAQDNQLEWIGTVRARLGWLWTPNVLVYGTGGVAYGAVKGATSLRTVPTLVPQTAACPGNAYCSLGSGSATLTGWVAGAGIEYALDARWRVSVDYQHFDLGDLRYAVQNASFITGAYARPYMDTAARFNGNILRAGISYTFN